MLRIWGLFLIGMTSAIAPAHALTPEHLTIFSVTGARDFYLYTPKGKKPKGLIVMLHGCKTNAAEFDQGTEMSAYATAKNYAVLYPEQNVLANYDHCWNWFWGTETPIIAEGIKEIQVRFNIDRSHTFLMGMSAGAAQGAILANCNRDLFSGVLLHSGLQYLAATSLDDANAALTHGAFTTAKDAAQTALTCNFTKDPMQFMIVHGTADPRVNIINDEQNVNELNLLNQLLAHESHSAGILATSSSTVPANGLKLGYAQTTYSIDGVQTGIFLKVEGLAHEWSGGNPVQPRNNPNGPKVVDLFFQSFHL